MFLEHNFSLQWPAGSAGCPRCSVVRKFPKCYNLINEIALWNSPFLSCDRFQSKFALKDYMKRRIREIVGVEMAAPIRTRYTKVGKDEDNDGIDDSSPQEM